MPMYAVFAFVAAAAAAVIPPFNSTAEHVLVPRMGIGDWHHDRLHFFERFDCYREVRECVNINVPNQDGLCRDGYGIVGFDYEHCDYNGRGEARPICCAEEYIDKIPVGKRCEWQDCYHGTGAPGDMILFRSKYGGTPDVHKDQEGVQCQWNNNQRHFSCPLPEYDDLMKHCTWRRGLFHTCPDDEWQLGDWIFDPVLPWSDKFCCKKERYSEKPFTNCHWLGHGLCEHNDCNPFEVVMRHEVWSGWRTCLENRKKAMCCTPHTEALGV